MSMFGDYKSYVKYKPAYEQWRYKRDLADAKRDAYLKMHPELVNDNDIQRGKALLRAIDIMDDYSQKKAENMEVVTEGVIAAGIEMAILVGGLIGGLVGSIKPIGEFFQKFATKGSKHAKLIGLAIPAGIGALVATMAAFPLMAWGAKVEVGASRKGRFESMRKDLSNPKGFAILNEEQQKQVNNKAKHVVLEEDVKQGVHKKISNIFSAVKDMAVDSDEYVQQRLKFEKELEYDENHLDKEMSEKEILNAKRDQQLLTKLIEKIDIASQDYAENSELVTQNLFLAIGAGGLIFTTLLEKLLNRLNIKSAAKINIATKSIVFTALTGESILAAYINKEASRIGRFKAKQELLSNPNNFIYVDDEKLNDIKNVKVTPRKKTGMLEFLKTAWKNTKEFDKYKKSTGKEERKYFKAIESIDLSDEQMKDAKQLQRNVFKTFNKIDENSQKYAENIEALGQSLQTPISIICSAIGIGIGMKYVMKKTKTHIETVNNFMKYYATVLLSTAPMILINAFITKEQKKASRIANMISIEELNDYRKFG